jgi:hypothetical protein
MACWKDLHEIPEYQPHVSEFTQALLSALLNSSATRSPSDLAPGAGVGFGVKPTGWSSSAT